MKLIPLTLILTLIGMTSSYAIQPPTLNSETLNFDDLDGSTGDVSVPNGYGAIATWTGFKVTSADFAFNNSNPIPNDVISDPNAAFSAGGSIINDTPFTLTSLYLGSLNFNANDVTITGKDSVGDILYTNTFTVDHNAAVLETLNYSLVSEVDFSSTSNFTVDNLTLAAQGVPEPSTYALMGLTLLAAAGFGAFRKFARQA